MSHLIVEQGKDMGRQITVPEDGLKFGRSPVNDIVLKHPSVMLFHGRFFFKSDNTLWVTDFGAAEKTTVGGEPIDEIQLKAGDLIKVGATSFRVRHALLDESDAEDGAPAAAQKPAPAPAETTETPASSPEPATEPAPAAESKEIDLGFKSSKTAPAPKAQPLPTQFSSGRSGLLNKFMIVAVVFVVIGVIGYVGYSVLTMSKPVVQQQPLKDVLTLSYERVRGDGMNIFRYTMELSGNGEFVVQIDDMKNNRHTTKKLVTTEQQRNQLSKALLDSGFMEITGDPITKKQGEYDLADLAVMRNRKFNRIRVLNRSMPPAFKKAHEYLEQFAKDEVKIPITWNLTVPELMALAKESVLKAEDKYISREVAYENLWTSLKHYEEALLYMETMDPKPPLYRKAENGLEQVLDAIEEKFSDTMFLVEKAVRLEDYEEAAKYLQYLLQLIPDRADARYQKVNSKLLQVEPFLRSR